jgi:hypothetical protein
MENTATEIIREEPKLNRDQRRAMAKLEKRANRNVRQPRVVVRDTMGLAADRAALMTDIEQMRIMSQVNYVFGLMKKGEWRAPDYNFMADILNTAGKLTGAGFNIMPDYVPYIEKAMDAANEVCKRVAAGHGWHCKAPELAAVNKAIACFFEQIQVCSRSEYVKANRLARGVVKSTRIDASVANG